METQVDPLDTLGKLTHWTLSALHLAFGIPALINRTVLALRFDIGISKLTHRTALALRLSAGIRKLTPRTAQSHPSVSSISSHGQPKIIQPEFIMRSTRFHPAVNPK